LYPEQEGFFLNLLLMDKDAVRTVKILSTEAVIRFPEHRMAMRNSGLRQGQIHFFAPSENTGPGQPNLFSGNQFLYRDPSVHLGPKTGPLGGGNEVDGSGFIESEGVDLLLGLESLAFGVVAPVGVSGEEGVVLLGAGTTSDLGVVLSDTPSGGGLGLGLVGASWVFGPNPSLTPCTMPSPASFITAHPRGRANQPISIMVKIFCTMGYYLPIDLR
jgi:hypothetical protein